MDFQKLSLVCYYLDIITPFRRSNAFNAAFRSLHNPESTSSFNHLIRLDKYAATRADKPPNTKAQPIVSSTPAA